MCRLKELMSSAAPKGEQSSPCIFVFKKQENKTAKANAADHIHYKYLVDALRLDQLPLPSRQAKGYWYTTPWLELSICNFERTDRHS